MAAKLFVTEEEGASLKVCTDLVEIRTEERVQIIDLTALVAERVRRSGVFEGLVCVQSRHTTAAVAVNEDEPLLLEDMKALLERLVPRSAPYGHDDRRRRAAPLPADESVNGDSHCRALLLGPSQTLTIAGGRLQLGEWQSVFLVELDGPRKRSLSLVVLGARRA
ncbi:MAG TPA: secondary thiamine-phosphate synthase enzyme YjbQ [Vicinamibacteria bacterium]|nr:secondary thiamine-phosphate synthase enzyme YjbQ [Vicinamibacteria bacterium]